MNFMNRSQSEFDGAKSRRIATSGWFTPGVVGVICLALLFTAYEHQRGNLHWLHTYVAPIPVEAPQLTGPGGPPSIHLTRTATTIGSEPEFISVTLLPGRGLDVLQITASIPGHGEISLLSAPPGGDVKRLMTNEGKDANGRLGASFGGAFLAPWAGFLTGSATDSDGLLQTGWQGHRLTFPADVSATDDAATGPSKSIAGLLLNRVADGVKTGVIDDGQSAEAIFHLGSFSGAWVSSVDVTTDVELTGHSVDLTMTAKNNGTSAMPIGLGWMPHFNVVSGQRESATLLVPSTMHLDVDKRTGVPTGTMSSVVGTGLDFQRAEGTKLGTTTIDETYVNLHRAVLADGPIIELRDAASNYGVRLLPLSDSITSLHVEAPANQDWVALSPNTNVNDPLGKEWSAQNPSGIHVLQPGETFKWKVRLEIFAVTGGTASASNN